MNMACPCCSIGAKINTLDSNMVDLNSTKGKPEHSSVLARRTKAATEGRLLAKFELCKPRDTSAHRQVSSSLSSRSHCKGLSNVKSMQQQASNDLSHCRTISSQNKSSAKPKTRERKTLAYVLHEKNASEGVINANSSCKHSVIFKNYTPEFADMQVSHTSYLHSSVPVCREVTADNMNQNHSRIHVRCSGLPDGLVDSAQTDHDDSEESEREMEDSICLSSFTFGSRSQSLPLFESHTNGKRALVRQLSSESCISMLSLDCPEDQLSASGPFSSADLRSQEEMTKFSIGFPETRNSHGNEASVEEPCFDFEASRPVIQPGSNLRMEREKKNYSNIGLPPRKGMLKGQTVVLNLEKDFQPHAKSKKRARSAINERHKIGNRRTKKALLNVRRCRGIEGHNGAAVMDNAFNVGLGIGVSYMLCANWKEFKRLNDLLERIESLVHEMQQQAQSKKSPLLGCLSSLRIKNPQVKKDEQSENFQNAGLKANGAVEPMLKSINMADLEAALEAELVLMQQNLDGAELQASPGDFDEWNPEEHSSIVDDLLRECGHEEAPRHSSSNDHLGSVHHAVSPNALNKRLHEVLEAQQEKRILNLEAQVEAREIELMMKEKELQCWKDIAHHLVKSYQDKPEQIKSLTTIDKGIFFLDGNDCKAQKDSSSVKKDARKHFFVDYLHQQREDSKSTYSVSATSCMSERVRDNELSARKDFSCEDKSSSLINPSFEDSKSTDSVSATSCISERVCGNELSARPSFSCKDMSSSLINPSFEAVILRNTSDWSIGDIQTYTTVSAWKEESDFSVSSDIARNCSNEAWADQDARDLLKGLDADKMFPWLLSEEDCLAKFLHLGESTAISNNSSQLGFVNEDYYCMNAAKT